MKNKKTIVVSGISLYTAGPLSIFLDCLEYLNSNEFNTSFNFIILVYKKDLFDLAKYQKMVFFEFPKSKNTYFHRIYYEYFYFKKLASSLKVDFWLSLHDITPFVGKIPQAVYCHNPAPFDNFKFSNLFIEYKHFSKTLFYKYLYKINLKRNKYIIVQQEWLRTKFSTVFNIERDKIIVSIPSLLNVKKKIHNKISTNSDKKYFFYPCYPRPFKNIEVICDAVIILNQLNYNFEIILTINGCENTYASNIFKKYGRTPNINFIGFISRDKVFNIYERSDFLIFPSKLESWGLPITEFKELNKPMIVADLPYARETVGKYEKVKFFDVNNAFALAKIIESFIKNEINFDKTNDINYSQPFAQNWEQLFKILLKF